MAYIRYPVCSPYRLLWALFRDRTRPADYIHYAFAQYVWRRRTPYNYVMLALLMVGWPVIFVGASFHFLRKCGMKVKRLTGKGLIRQLGEQVYCAVRHSVAPSKYYIFDLYKDERRARAGEYIIRYTFKGGIHNLMNEWMEGRSETTKRIINNKQEFDRYCAARGLQTMGAVCGTDRDGALTWEAGYGPDLPPVDLFIKPTKGKGGRGCERWDCVEPGRYRKYGTGERLSSAELLAHVQALGRRQRYLVQPRAVNHPALRELSGAALSSMRIMSIRNHEGQIEVLFAVFKISGHGGSIVDNFHAGGFVCMVDMETGELGAATDWGVKKPGRWLDHHPITGAPIVGTRLPLWRETVDLVRRTHEAFADRIVIGWDVAITENGPAIIEGNGQFGLDMVQRTHQMPAGNTRFCELYAWHVSQALHERYGLPPRPLPSAAAVSAGIDEPAEMARAG